MTLLRKHGLWLVVATLVGVAGAFLYHSALQVSYASVSQVDVEAHVVALTTPVTPNMATEAQVATSGIVVANTARALGMNPTSLANALKAKTSGTANVLSITCTMPTPAAAQRCAAAAAAAYTAFRNDVTASKVTQAHDPLQVTLVTAASLPHDPAGLGKKILLPLGAFFGFMVGLGAVAIRDHFDDRVRDRPDLERCLTAPVVAAVPRVRRGAGDPAFVFSDAPQSPAAEAYRYLRARLNPLIAATSGDGAVVLVVGARAREGRTSVAINLATALAHAGDSVILVDADLRHPSLSEGLGAGERYGLTDLLGGRASLEEVIVPTDVPRLRLVSAGRARQPADLLDEKRLSRAFDCLRAATDVVVVDSAPVLAASDAIALAGVSDLVIVVADVIRTRRGDVRAAGQQIEAAGPQTIVGILNRVPQPFMNRPLRESAQEPVSLAPPASVPTILASNVPPRGPNGQGRPIGRRRPSNAGTGGDEGSSRDAPGPGPPA
jgi:capsular exopolysaccharide synthesis family protein